MFFIRAANPCSNDAECCQKWTNLMANNLKAIMKVMRFANRRGQSHYELTSLINNDNYRMLQYNLTPNIGDWNLNQLDYQSLIPQCNLHKSESHSDDVENIKYFDQTKRICNLFEPVFTDMGICHAYNTIPIVDILKPSYYTESFQGAFGTDIRNNSDIHMGTKNGEVLTFYLYGNFKQKIAMILDMGTSDEMRPTNFFFGISNMKEYFGIKTSRKVIQGGYKVTWKVQAMEIVPSEDLRSLPIKSRNCRFADESEEMELFDIYTKTGCEFELNVKKAKGICKCMPWYLPSPSQKKYPICDLNGNLCFKTFMNESNLDDICLPNCHEVQFTSSEVLEKLDPEEFCDEQLFYDGTDYDFRQAYKKLQEKEITMKIRTFLNSEYAVVELVKRMKQSSLSGNETLTGIKKELCLELVRKDLAKVKVMFERKKYLKTSTSLRMTFPDKLGAFGK